MGGCRAGLRERRFVGRASPPPLPPPTPPSPLLPRYLRSGVPSAFAGGIGPQSAANTLNRVQRSISQDSAIPPFPATSILHSLKPMWRLASEL